MVGTELSSPQHWFKTPEARFWYTMLLMEMVRQYFNWRQETSLSAVASWEARKARWRVRRTRFNANSVYRLRRAALIFVGLYVAGYAIDALSDRCDSAWQCILLFPRLMVENLPQALQIALYIALGLMQLFMMFYAMTKVGSFKFIYPGTITDTFDDVFGQDAARDRLIEQIDLLEDDQKVEKAGGHMPKGVLLWGPPGTGKTLMAKAAANRSTKPLILIPPGGFASTFIGINFLKVWQLFRYVRKLSLRYGGVIVFFDEIDSLGNRGGGVVDQAHENYPPSEMGCAEARLPLGHTWNGEGVSPQSETASPLVARLNRMIYRIIVTGGGGQDMGTLTAFLAAMDGMDQPRGILNRVLSVLGFSPVPAPKYHYLMIGATNRLSALDQALLRPGRFGRKIKVGYPKFDGRLNTYQGYLNKVDHELTEKQIEWAARNHYRGTGAEIRDIVNEALLMSFRKEDEHQGHVTFRDLMDAMMWVRYGEGEGQMEWDRNQWMLAVHEAGHAVAFHHLARDTSEIWVSTVEQHGTTGGFVAPSPLYDDWVKTFPEMINQMQVGLASRVAEELLLGTVSNGHGGDGPAVTRTAQKMVAIGHGNRLATLTWEQRSPKEYSNEVEMLVQSAYIKCRELLLPRTYQIAAVAALLWGEGTVEGARIHETLDVMEEQLPKLEVVK